MKRAIASLFFLLLLPSAALAAPLKGGYFIAHLGLQNLDDAIWSGPGYSDEMTHETGVAITLGGGYDFGYVRLEGEYSYAYNDAETYTFDVLTAPATYQVINGGTYTTALTANLYVEIDNPSGVVPYLMAGIGIAIVEIYDVELYDGFSYYWMDEMDDTTWIYQYGGGIDFAFNNTFSLDISYRRFEVPDLRLLGTDVEHDGDRYLAGIRIRF